MTEINEVDVDHAIFALGRFIDYRLAGGMQEDWLFPYMQAYLNLVARREGRESPDLHELRSQTTFDGPENPEEVNQWTPVWLPYGEKLLCHRRLHGIDQNTCDPDESQASESAAVAQALVSS